MDSSHNQPIPVTSPSTLSLSTESRRHCRSKAQMCLFKILRIISLFTAVDVSYEQRSSHDDRSGENRRCDVDLNIGLCASTEIEPFEYPLAAKGGADCRDCVVANNDLHNDLFLAEKTETFEEERTTEQSEISHVGDQSSGIDCNGASEVEGEKKIRDKGYLDLLIEAAELILANEKTEPSRSIYVESSTTAEKGGGTKRKHHGWTAAAVAVAEWYPEFEDTSPVVKSNRGRNQVLPLKYRDSIVEPLVRWPSSRHRSNSDAAFPVKRRSK